ncbi:MAG: S41 family peptidase [Tepidisphaeraceae bacterium]
MASLILCLAAVQAGAALTDARRAEHVRSFDYVWQTIHDKFYDPKFNGIDWDAVRAELRPRMQQVQSDEEAQRILADLVGRLKLSHFAVLDEDHPHPTSRSEFVPPLAKDAPTETVTFGSLPPLPLRYTFRMLPDHVGYFYLSIFIDPAKVMPAFREAIEASRDAKGFILDLRHNPGGLGVMAIGMGNAFVSEPNLKLGTMIQRDGPLNFVLNPQADPYTKPLAILIDEWSGSTAEILAGGLKDLGRARIFGERSAGMALPSFVEKLPNGMTFQYAVANYVSTGGKPLEGQGVTPDQVVPYPPPYNEPDPVVAAATKWMTSQAEKQK